MSLCNPPRGARFRFRPLFLLPVLVTALASRAQTAPKQPWAIEIHGGAGEAEWLDMTADAKAAYSAYLSNAVTAGADVLKAHGSAMDAVQASIEVLEDSGIFNSGRGSAFASDGTNEMDASI